MNLDIWTSKLGMCFSFMSMDGSLELSEIHGSRDCRSRITNLVQDLSFLMRKQRPKEGRYPI